MRKYSAISVALFLFGLIISAHGQLGQITPQAGLFVPSSGGCSQATALIARMDGSQNTSAITTRVCAAVTNGYYSKLDLWYVGDINSVGNSLLNWVSSSFSLTATGSITFTANKGWTGDGSTGRYAPGYTFNTNNVHYVLNSGIVGTCIVTSRTAAAAYIAMGVGNGTNFIQLVPNFTGNVTLADINDGTSTSKGSIANAQGSWMANRTASNAITINLNGSSILSGSQASGAVPTMALSLLARNDSGTFHNFSADQIAEFMVGGGFTASDVTNFYTDSHAYHTTMGLGAC